MRKTVFAVAAVFVALLAGCSTKSNSASSQSGNTSVQGVTPTTIRVGVTYVDFSAIRNVVNIDQGDFVTSYKAVINEINAHGGIDGRTIVPYFAAVNPIGTAGAAQACTQLTEDDKVFAVLGFFNNTDPLCYLVTHGVNTIGGPATGASLSAGQQQQAKATWFNSTLSDAHLVPKELDAFNRQGVFAGHKVAVVGLAQDQNAVQNLVVPELHKLGVNVVQTAINDAPTTDTTAAYQQFAVIAQKFQADGADVVVAAGSGASEAWPMALQVNRSTYLPRLVATDASSLEGYVVSKAGYDPAVLQGAISGTSVLPWYQIWQDPGMQHCLSLIQAAGPKEAVVTPTVANSNSEPQSWVSAGQACANVSLFAYILKAAGRNLDNATFQKGGESLANVTDPGSGAAGPLHFSNNYHDGNGPIVVYSWDPGTKSFATHVAA